MRSFLRQNWVYLVGALLLHVLFAGVFGLTMIQISRNAPPPQLAIQAVVVDESMLKQVSQPPRPRPEDKQKLQAQQREQELAEQRKQEQAKRETEQRAERERQAEQQRRQEEEQRRIVEEQQLRERQEQQRQREAQAEKQRQAQAEKERLAEAERKRVEEIKRRQEEEAKRRAAAEAKAQAAREDELRKQLEAEEDVMQARGSSAMAQYVALIRQHVERRWIRPPSARAGLDCEVRVVQAPGGSVLSAQVTRCNGDAAVRQSIETAVLRSSPLPPPSDPRLFERTLLLQFKPQLD